MAATFVPVPGLNALVASMPEMFAEMEQAAQAIAEIAKGMAPVDEGDYRDSIEGHAEYDPIAIGIVSATGDPEEQAIYLEFGTNDTPTFGTLRRAAESFRL